MKSQSHRLHLLLAAVLLPAASLFAAEPTAPQYGFKHGESYVYQIRIETQESNYTGMLQGVVTYTARSVNPHGFTLRTTGTLHPARKMKDGRAFPPFGVYRVGLQYFDNAPTPPSFPFRQPRDVVFDTKGALIQQGDAAPQPMLFDVTSFIIEPLSPKEETKWELTDPTVVVHEELEPVGPGGISRLVRIKKNNLIATEKISYSLAPGTNATTVIIKKQLEVKTRQMVGDSPRIQITGEGEIVFDTKLGVPRSMEFKQTLAEAEENLTRKTPMTLTYKLLDGKEREAALAPLSTNRLATGTNRPPAKIVPPKAEPKPLTDTERTQTLADLKSARTFTKRIAANRLAEAAVTSKNRDEVLKSLAPLLADNDLFTRAAGVKALGTWGNRDSVTTLLKMMDDYEFSVRWAVFDALVALKDPRAIEPFAKFLATGKDNHRTSQSLRSFGPAAEESVIKLLAETNVGTQREAAQLLQDIGAKKSLGALEKLLPTADPSVKFTLESAIKAIQERERAAKDAKK